MRILVLIVLTLLAVLPGIATLPPLDRDEARYVQATKQMLESGDFVDIRFQEQSRYKKPVGIYWMQSAVALATGDGPAAPIWQYRLVSAAGILLVVLATFWAGLRLFGADAGFVGGLTLAVLFGVAFEGHIAKTDAMLLGLATLAQAALLQVHAAVRGDRPVRRHLPWVFWSAQAVAILVKGPIAPLLSGLTVLALLAFERDGRWLRALRPVMGLSLALVIVLPWLVAITLKSDGAFWQEAVGRDMLGKVAQGEESHGAPPGYFVLTFGLYFWPFGLVAVWAGLTAWGRARAEPAILALLCWYVPFWLLFELIPTKLPHYVLPAYPALALLLGWMVAGQTPFVLAGLPIWRKALVWLAGAGHVVVTLALAAAVIIAPLHFGSGWSWWSVPAAVGALAAGALAVPWRMAFPTGRVATAAAATAGFHIVLFGALFPSLDRIWLSPRIAEEVRDNARCPGAVLASSSFHEPSLVFLAGTVTKLTGLAGVAQHLSDDPACALGLVRAAEMAELERLLGANDLRLVRLGSVSGLNYSKGETLDLTVVGAER